MSVAISTDRGGDAAASCPCLFVSLKRPRVATENGRGKERRFRETIRNQRSGK